MSRTLYVRVNPGSNENEVAPCDASDIAPYFKTRIPHGTRCFFIHCIVQAHKGKANEAVRRLIAFHEDVPLGIVTLVRGATTRNKVFTIG